MAGTGRRRGGRPGQPASDLAGVVVIDKPTGPTSHDVVERVRRTTGQPRAGHTGTLDPAATGVLVVCLGRATRLVRFLQAGSKTYAARMMLGVETTTQDADGEVVAATDAGHVDERALCEALTRYQGTFEQIPPMVSAVKVAGERLHEKARRGEEVPRAPRRVTVHDLVLDAFEPGARPEASFLVTCTAGTYVRTLAHDVGRDLGVGASLLSLRRVANGPFTSDEACTLEQLEAAAGRDELAELLLPTEEAVARALPAVAVDDDALLPLARGGSLPVQGRSGPFAVWAGPRLIGVYRDRDGQARPELVWLRPEEL